MTFIQSLLPNPKGDDKEGEYIVIANQGAETVDVSGWVIEDRAGGKFILRGVLSPGESRTLPYSETRITLNNDADAISLYNAKGTLQDRLSYKGSPPEGDVVARSETRAGFEGDARTESFPSAVSPAFHLGGLLLPTMVFLGVALAAASFIVFRHFVHEDIPS